MFLALVIPVGGGGTPTHPIAPGGPPLDFWGGVAPPVVSHPIAPGGPPPGIWPSPPSPGHPSHPIAPGGQPPMPSHPIVIPPGQQPPVAPTHPISGLPEPSHPIVLPPGDPAGKDGYYLAYVPALGKFVYVPVSTPK
jgi:hypothetical protein